MAIRTTRAINKQKNEKFNVPKNTQDTIPINTVYNDGIFLVGKKKYAKTFMFEDINYAVASAEDQESMFYAYSDLLNGLDSSATTKITIRNHRMNIADFKEKMLFPMMGDRLDKYREELNDMLLDKVTEANAIIQERYITISADKNNIAEARSFFNTVEAELNSCFSKLGSKCNSLSSKEKLKVIYNFYREKEDNFHFDIKEFAKDGRSFKDHIAPDSIEWKKDHFIMSETVPDGEKYGRVLFLRDIGNSASDKAIKELCEANSNLILSFDITPIPNDVAVRDVQNTLTGVEKNMQEYRRKARARGDYSDYVPYDMEQQKKVTKEFLDDLQTRDQRMIHTLITIVLTAENKEQLDIDTKSLIKVAGGKNCQLGTLNWQQMDGLNTVLPFGVKNIEAYRTLTTEGLAVLTPFRVQEIMHQNGVFLGQNAISNNLLMLDKSKLQNPNALRFGVPGSGKSFGAKMEIFMIALLYPNDDILICDPEDEYTEIVEVLDGQVINLSAGSTDYINALDMVENYGESKNSVRDKSEFILSLFEQISKYGLEEGEASIIDRCVRNVYEAAQIDNSTPTLVTLRDELLKQPDAEAKKLATRMEIFTTGSLDVFAHQTNVNINNRIVSYNIKELKKTLKTVGLLVITDTILNRVTVNDKNKKRTHVFIDEFHVVFQNEHSATFFESAWRMFRKRNACPTGITQNVKYLLNSIEGTTMISNSEFIVMNNQSENDREELGKLLNISSEQMNYITNAGKGSGLVRVGNALVPFKNKFPKDTELYELFSTDPNE